MLVDNKGGKRLERLEELLEDAYFGSDHRGFRHASFSVLLNLSLAFVLLLLFSPLRI